MNSRKYFLVNNIPGQPFPDIRCYISEDTGGEYVAVRAADIRLPNCPESITARANLSPIPGDTVEMVCHKNGLVSFFI